ncbi:MAG: methylenetetrahydrofolate reductase C-terminal domain-containing protein [Lentisphaeria bacterium]|nr:methylenetetrahydrofolate reductase C-terminal domain-containing protein [Lentisphaeria bacterium]NQZ67976.1 methylenetetrahydrofolate reductase C-terminal domain-containing protein [Lentisphaeria bacterium]
MKTRQLRVAAESDGSLKKNLTDGIFSMILEYALPLKENPLMMATEEALKLIRFTKRDKRICSFALHTGLDANPRYDCFEIIKILKKASRSQDMIVFLNGMHMNIDRLRDNLINLADQDISGLVISSALADIEHPMDDAGNPKLGEERYMDSIKMLYYSRKKWPQVFTGAMVNPFKYNIDESYLQYYKAIRNLNTGADALWTEAGWDMRKLQEFQWYLRLRDHDVPVIARLLFLHEGDSSKIIQNKFPGITMSREGAAQIQRLENEEHALYNMQIDSVAMQVAGCRLMGYSGVQLAGIDRLDTAKSVIDRSMDMLTEFKDYAEWVEAWKDMNGRMNHPPATDSYYVYKNLLDPDCLDYDAGKTPISNNEFEIPKNAEKLKYMLAQQLGLDKKKSNPLLKRILCDLKGKTDWALDKTMLNCAANCPKGLEEGPCESSRPGGLCEFGDKECFYIGVVRLASWQNKLADFETAYDDG